MTTATESWIHANIHIYRDLSHNALTAVPKRAFKGAPALRSLQLDNNQITCLDEGAVKGLTELEIL